MAEHAAIETHVQDAVNRLLERHKGRPNITALVSNFAQKIQDLEDASAALSDLDSILTQSGIQLDLIGDIIGLSRLGVDDDTYRVLLIVQIAINNSQGDPEALITIFSLLTGATQVLYTNMKRARVRIQGNGENPIDSDSLLYKQLERVTLAGVRLISVGFTTDNPFVYSGGAPGVGGGYNEGEYPSGIIQEE